MPSPSDPPSDPSGPGLLGALALGLACALAATVCDRGWPAHEGEPLWLRWTRAAADHPVRTALAAACLRLAWGRRAQAPPRGDGPENETEGRDPW